MTDFILQHEIITLIAFLSLLWALERTVRAFINRHKPQVSCDCQCQNCSCGAKEDEDAEV